MACRRKERILFLFLFFFFAFSTYLTTYSFHHSCKELTEMEQEQQKS